MYVDYEKITYVQNEEPATMRECIKRARGVILICPSPLAVPGLAAAGR